MKTEFAPVRGDYTLDDAKTFDFYGYIGQEKIDGKRAMLDCDTGKLWGRNSDYGFFRGNLPAGCVLDGELVRDKFHAFDLVRYNGQDISIEPLHFRLKLLWTLTGDFEQVLTCEDPRILADLVAMKGGEGIVAKIAEGAYMRGGWLKFKKLVTLDFTIVNIDRMKNSAEVSQDGISRGRIMAVPDHVQVGDVVEVAHMEITKDGKLRHGRFVRVHQEKRAA